LQIVVKHQQLTKFWDPRKAGYPGREYQMVVNGKDRIFCCPALPRKVVIYQVLVSGRLASPCWTWVCQLAEAN
jgi:hypothetical protein